MCLRQSFTLCIVNVQRANARCRCQGAARRRHNEKQARLPQLYFPDTCLADSVCQEDQDITNCAAVRPNQRRKSQLYFARWGVLGLAQVFNTVPVLLADAQREWTIWASRNRSGVVGTAAVWIEGKSAVPRTRRKVAIAWAISSRWGGDGLRPAPEQTHRKRRRRTRWDGKSWTILTPGSLMSRTMRASVGRHRTYKEGALPPTSSVVFCKRSSWRTAMRASVTRPRPSSRWYFESSSRRKMTCIVCRSSKVDDWRLALLSRPSWSIWSRLCAPGWMTSCAKNASSSRASTAIWKTVLSWLSLWSCWQADLRQVSTRCKPLRLDSCNDYTRRSNGLPRKCRRSYKKMTAILSGRLRWFGITTRCHPAPSGCLGTVVQLPETTAGKRGRRSDSRPRSPFELCGRRGRNCVTWSGPRRRGWRARSRSAV